MKKAKVEYDIRRRNKTQKQTSPIHISQDSSINKSLNSLYRSKIKENSKKQQIPIILNLSIPVRNMSQNRNKEASRTKLDCSEIRAIKNNDFLFKLRRKQQTRTKMLIQRLQAEDRVMSLIQLCEKWRQSAILPPKFRSRAQTIQQLRKQIKHRNDLFFSNGKAPSMKKIDNPKMLFSQI